MGLKPKEINKLTRKIEFLRDAKNLEYTVGNVALDATKFSEDTLVPAGTAVFENDTTGLFELVQSSTPATMKAAVLTTFDVQVEANGENELVGCVRKASVIEERTHGVTDNFKQATQGRIVFDV